MSLNLKERYGLLINNEWVKASDGAEFNVYNPANGEQLAICAEATNDDVDKAVESATEAFKTWKKVSQVERADYLLKIADAIDAHKEHLAQVETYDNGKPIRETLNVDIPLGADHFRYFAGVLRSEEGSAQVFDENTLSLIVREPIGVVGQVVPWNFPFLMAAWKLAPALAAGCTVVIKPSSHTSLSLLELGDILKEILPPGVVNIVTGKGSKSGQYIPSTQLGSLIYEDQVNKVLSYVDLAKEEGARIVAGGVRVTDGELGKGCFVRPTLIVDATNDMRVAREEIFGPVAVVIKFHSEEEVIEQANDSLYGLGGGVFTQNINRAIRVARGIETGRMWVNTYNSIPAGAPFGGYKQSGIGRETHKVILEHYTQMKNIIVNLSDKPSGFYDLD
ncbi:MAG: aldehyde dehydrogenase family protein [Veillonella sp.]|nr:aldehyde dehydrogenase family protein [Veillonella sp.]